MVERQSEHQEPIALACYEAMAEEYAAAVDSKPHNAYYERPAVLSLLPSVAGKQVLDVGCGSGWYAEYLVEQGVTVTAIEVSPKMVAFTQARLGGRATVLEVDLGRPLDFANAAFDLVLCPLVMHYLKDWHTVFCEFHRVLKTDGQLLFSTHHPFMDFQQFEVDDYFATELLEDNWSMGKVFYYRRPLTAMIDALADTGFVVERILEPRPTDDYKAADPEWHQRLSTNPWFLVIRARVER